ncbi:MAG TPA: hypothetical protein VME23_13190 [Terracidiphilus sp.]|nr:hypothetical protein [Terracidiphilus sp.]
MEFPDSNFKFTAIGVEKIQSDDGPSFEGILVVGSIARRREMSWFMNLFFILLFTLAYLVSPTALVWGWAELTHRRPVSQTLPLKLSLLGFLLATSSALLGLTVILLGLYGTFENFKHTRLFYRSILIGGALSAVGFLFAIAGVSKSHQLRWQAPVGALGTLAFWLIATTWP